MARRQALPEEGRAFPAFPFPPYDIQQGFMQALYAALDKGGVGLFESPTGTGKTLSLICGSLQWLQDQRRREAEAAQIAASAGENGHAGACAAGGGAGAAAGPDEDDDDAPDWMRCFGEQQERERQRQLAERQASRIARARAKLRSGGCGGKGSSRAKPTSAGAAAAGGPDAEFLVEDWHSGGSGEEGDGGLGGARRKRSPGSAGLGLGSSGSSSEGGGEGLGEEEELEVPRKRQIIFVSRTHSQLSQFVGELHRTPFADELSLVALGSRKALCINEAVLRLQSAPLINERCLELQKPGGGGSGSRKAAAVGGPGGGDAVGPQRKAAGKAGGGAAGRCPYLASGSQAAATTRDMLLAQPMDIEELAKLGRRKSVCPYYSARRALPEADVVLAPYSCLLARDTRQALGLRLEGNVVIVDEGHNLVDAVNSCHSAELSAAQAGTAHSQLAAYFQRFQPRLAPGNCRHIQTLLRVAQVLTQAASGATRLAAPAADAGPGGDGSCSAGGAVLTVNNFLVLTGLDNLNLFKLVSYVREGKAVYKIAGFWQAQQQRDVAAAADAAAAGAGGAAAAAADGGASGAGTGALHALVAFLQALTSADADGRIVVQPPADPPQQAPQVQQAQQQQQRQLGGGGAPAAAAAAGTAGGAGGLLKYVLLNAAAHFGEVVSAAHAVVLASGTLSPLESVLHLFPGLPPHRLHRFACGHVVGRERLLALALGAGPSGASLDFRHAARGSPATIDELGRLLLNTCQVVPGGVVVFFPSFSYADQVHARWQQSGLLRQLGTRKRVLREPRTASEVEACLQQYADCIAAAVSGCSSGAAGVGSSNAGGKLASLGSSSGGSTSASASASRVTGAVMLCVVGGKLAEGINFGDSLGRCVIMVGLPYPNPSDPELQERMRFMDRAAAAAAPAAAPAAAAGLLSADDTQAALGTSVHSTATSTAASGAPTAPAHAQLAAAGCQPAPVAAAQQVQQQQQQQPRLPLAAETGREYYSNLCMKAVNQCVGRVIRHRGDWAAVLLVDARYASAVDASGRPMGPLAKLPGWIQHSLRVGRSFGDAFGQLSRFTRTMAAADAAAAPAPAGAC